MPKGQDLSLRLGSIRYINSLPIDLGLLSKAIPFSGEIVQEVPAKLNQKMLEGAIDVGPVSTYFYAKHQERFEILPHLSISSHSGVQSVLLFSRSKPQELSGKTILLTGEGQTTPILLTILCQKIYGFKPQLEFFSTAFKGDPGEAEAILLIGDDALIYRKKMETLGYQVTDLAQLWQSWTGFGFVFAVWVVRRELLEKQQNEIVALHGSLLASRDWGLAHREAMIQEARQKTGLAQKELEDYFSCLSYDLDENLCKGMELYFQYAQELGFLDSKMDKSYNNKLFVETK